MAGNNVFVTLTITSYGKLMLFFLVLLKVRTLALSIVPRPSLKILKRVWVQDYSNQFLCKVMIMIARYYGKYCGMSDKSHDKTNMQSTHSVAT